MLRSPLGHWQLHRYPVRSNDPLQAWDAADELLHAQLATLQQTQQLPQHPLLVNDSFGALVVAVATQSWCSYTDSYVSHQAQLHNLEHNNLPTSGQQLAGLDALPADRDLILMKLPKSQSLLAFQLAKLSAELPSGTPIIVAAKSKLFTPAVRALFQNYCTDVSVSLIQRKCRILQGQLSPNLAEEAASTNTWQVPERGLTLHHLPGVFARNQLDIGARLLLDNLPAAGAEQVIDLGCGNGVLGLCYAKHSPASAVTWVDESYLAVASCARNVEANLPPSDGYRCVVDDCLTQQADNSVDLVLCNPPFHQEHAITEHIARQMFQDAKRVLRHGGELRLVANRHLPYYHFLKRLFRNVKTVASNTKFMVLSCTL
ncbi:methyltransferase [Pseudidiomarina sediminum]|uniref:methyltransferase n=1 Tax=Pseudidiomarina sediminum TaxID=431675 RepID=UPI001C975898|nr:methyltransferase [Pseudidiomarina sediminum]MBY6063383.1 methyltransferase [Pseudidiomarina sediminum]